MKIIQIEEGSITISQRPPEEHEENHAAPVDYDDPEQVGILMAKHLAKIFLATYRKKIEKELDKLKAKCT